MDPDTTFCPCCNGEAFLLGALGRLKHYRCRDCGATFSDQEASS